MPITRYSDPDAQKAITKTRLQPKVTAYTPSPKLPANTPNTLSNGTAWYMNPSANARPDTQYWWADQADQSRTLTPAQQSWTQQQFLNAPTGPTNPTLPTMPGSGRSSGGGGGGGAAGGLDQATLDWILSQLGMAKPKSLTATNLDLPDPSQYFGQYDTKPWDVARTGVTQGIQGIRDRGTSAIGTARDLLGSYQNPYATGLLSSTPDLQQQMNPMMRANGVNPGAVQATNNEGIQADQAMRNAMQMYAATDQRRQQDNLTANTGDLNTMNQNLDLEQLLLGLGIDTGQAKGQSAWDQMIKQAGYDAASTEAAQNWQRGNTVGDTNVSNNNEWNQGLISTLLSIIGSKAPGTTLPANIGAFV
jgi:hypothetical protein